MLTRAENSCSEGGAEKELSSECGIFNLLEARLCVCLDLESATILWFKGKQESLEQAPTAAVLCARSWSAGRDEDFLVAGERKVSGVGRRRRRQERTIAFSGPCRLEA